MLKKQKFQEQHFVPELLGRCETGLSLSLEQALGAKTNELIVTVITRISAAVLIQFFASRMRRLGPVQTPYFT